MQVSELFPSKYLAATDLESREFELAIKSLTLTQIATDGAASEEKPVIHFQGVVK